MTARLRTACMFVAALLAASAASAQTAADLWRFGTTVSLSSGAAVAASDTGPVVGGALGWEVTPRLALEGVASWLDRAEAPESFSAALRVRTGLMRQRSAPFLEGGFGLYRAGIDPGRASIPDFYRRRMVFGDAAHRQTFTDPAFLVGGGWTLFVSRHFSLQPAVEATIVTRDAHGYVLTAGVVRLGYHFEDHPVTP